MRQAKTKTKPTVERLPEPVPGVPAATPRPLWALLAIVALAAATDLIFYVGFFSSDDLQYTRGAIQLAESGKLSYITAGTIRLGIVLPLALVARLSHQNAFAMTLFFALFHLLVVIGTYWIGRLLHGVATGLLAAGLIAVCPLAAILATMVLPDHAATALMLFATGTLLVAVKLANADPESRRPQYLLAAVGLLLGLSATSKQVAVIMVPVFLAPIVLGTRKVSARGAVRLTAAFLAGFAMATVMYLGAFRLTTGLWSPLQDRSLVAHMGGISERVIAKGYSAPGDRFARLLSFGTDTAHLGLFSWAIVVSLLLYPLTRRRSWFLYLTVIWLCCYMTWGTFSLTHYTPPPMQIRYFVFVLPFLMIMVAHPITLAGGWVWRQSAGITALRYATLGAAALGCLLVVTSSYQKLDRLAGNLYFSPIIGGVRYALDFAALSDHRPVVLSYWLSARTGAGLPRATPYLITSEPTTSLREVASLLESDGFLYLDCEYEERERRPSPTTLSPLDAAVRKALAGRNPELSARTIGVFSQFATRSAGLQYLLGGVSDVGNLRRPGPLVCLREVTARREKQAGAAGQ